MATTSRLRLKAWLRDGLQVSAQLCALCGSGVMAHVIDLVALLLIAFIIGLVVMFAVYAVKTATLFNREHLRLDAEIAELKRRLGR